MENITYSNKKILILILLLVSVEVIFSQVLPEISIVDNATNAIYSDNANSPLLLNNTDFGNTDLSSPITKQYVIKNLGLEFLNLTSFSSSNSSFVITSLPANSIIPGGSTFFEVTFTPSSVTTESSEITILNNDFDEAAYKFTVSCNVANTALISESGNWSYLDDGSDQNTNWYSLGFDYSSWNTGDAEFGYGDGDETTLVSYGPSAANKYPTTYFKKSFNVTAIDITNNTLVMNAIRDDGMAVYLNGVEVWRDNMLPTFNYASYSAGEISGAAEGMWITKRISNALVLGNNEIAVEIHQRAPNSSDISFNFSMFTDNSFIFIPPTAPDLDADNVVDYIDSDDDNDGVTDILEGCYTPDLEELHSTGNTNFEESILLDFPILNHPMDNGNLINFSISNQADFTEITSYYAGEHGWAMRVKGPNTQGTLIWDFSNDIEGLFFKLVDFDENETWTVNVYDEFNNLIDLSISNNVYHLGTYITQTGNKFNDKFFGNGGNNNGDAVASDVLGSVYFYFPVTKIDRIEFLVDQPDGSTIRIAAMHYCELDTDGDGIGDFNDADSDNDGIPDLVEAGGVDIDGNGIVDNLLDTDSDGLVDLYDTTPFTYFSEEVTTIPNYDFDGDTVVNRIDLDSDNDGIIDLLEAGDKDLDANGMIDNFVDTNNDGYHDVYDGASGIAITGTDTNSDGFPDTYPNDNVDNIGFPNFMDLDSDDDGIVDNTESQATGFYINVSGFDTDNDGIDDSYDTNNLIFGGAGNIPVDTDGDGIFDYLDLDTDNSEEPDMIEGHDTNGDGVVDVFDSSIANTGLYIGLDIDNDGLDDGFDNDTTAPDPTNANTRPNLHPFFDGGTDADWRKSVVALDFDGLDDYVDFGDNHDFTGSFSLEAWVLQEATVERGTIISKGDLRQGSINKKGYHLRLRNSKPQLIWYDNSGTAMINLMSPFPINNSRWYHIASTFDGSTARLYIDGLEVASDSPISAPLSGSEKFIIGASYDSDTPAVPKNYFNGFIDEVRVWNVGLSESQIRQMMNQEIEQNGTNVRGKVVPLNVSEGLLWSNLVGYYPMKDDKPEDHSDNSKHGSPKNITTIELQTAPLPYVSVRDGDWGDVSPMTPWLYSNSVWDAPNALAVDGVTPIDWNIVQISHNIASGDKNITVLGLISDTENKILTIANPSETHDELNTGKSLRVTNYIELDGAIDLIGESQFLQDEGSILDNDSGGFIERDQQGTAFSFNYNYWTSSVGEISSGIGTKGSGVPSLNNGFTIANVLSDGSDSSNSKPINFQTNYWAADGAITSPITISSYWLFRFNGLNNDYGSWLSINENSNLDPGEGYAMKGTSGFTSLTDNQNYIFKGKPYNGDIELPISIGNDRLVGNPYLSAIDANQFILDNIKDSSGNASTNIFNGVLYFWDHFAESSHILSEYVGGYATYSLMGGVRAISSDYRINASGALGTKIPLRYISLNQGFFITTYLDTDLINSVTNITGGNIVFKNSQRIFKTEVSDSSVSFKTSSLSPSNEDERQKFRIMIHTPSGYYRQLLAGVDLSTSNNFDIGFDAPLLGNNVEDGFWLLNQSKFVIQAVNNFDDSQVLPIGVKIAEAGTIKFSLDGLDNFDESKSIYLHDKETGVYRDLRNNDYEVNISIVENLDRFEIVFNNMLLSSQEQINIDDSFKVFYSNQENNIIIKNLSQEKIESVLMLNILGQKVYDFSPMSNKVNLKLQTKELSPGGYIITIKTSKGRLSTKVLVN